MTFMPELHKGTMFRYSKEVLRPILLLLLTSGIASTNSVGQTSPRPRVAVTNYFPSNDFSPEIATDRAGNWVAVWESNVNPFSISNGDWEILVSRSTDNGATWAVPASVGSSDLSDLGPEIHTDGSGNWITVWSSRDDFGGTTGFDYDIVFSRSTDNGATWSPAALLNSSGTSDSRDDGQVKVAANGSGVWVAVWLSRDDLGGTAGIDADIFFSRSTDNGLTWSPTALLNSNGINDSRDDHTPSIATDNSGRWVTIWTSTQNLGGSGTDGDILVSRSLNNGATWSVPSVLNSNGFSDTVVDGDPSIATNALGTWIAVWVSGLPGLGIDYDVYFARSTNNGATWSAQALLNSDGNSDAIDDRFPVISTDATGRWAVAWNSETDISIFDLDIKLSVTSNSGATWSDPIVVNPGITLDQREPDIAVGALGNWIIVYESREDVSGLSPLWQIVSSAFLFPEPSTSIFVDFQKVGIEDGTQEFPFNSLAEAVDNIAVGGTINLMPGDSPETLTINKEITLNATASSARIGVSSARANSQISNSDETISDSGFVSRQRH